MSDNLKDDIRNAIPIHKNTELKEVKHLKSEIKKLNNTVEAYKRECNKLSNLIQRARAEAVREFAEAVVCDIDNYCEKNIKTKPFVDGVTGMQIAHNLVYKRLKKWG